MTGTPPISLIFDELASPIGDRLAKFVHSDADVFFDGDLGTNGQPFKLLYRGLSLVLTCGPVPDGVAPFRPIFFSGALHGQKSAVSIEFGANLAGGMMVPSLARSYLEFVAKISTVLEASAVTSNSAELIGDPLYFVESVDAYCAGGPFPALAMIAFDPVGNGSIATRGLDVFAGQEIVFHGNDWPENAVIRRMIRLVHDICTNGAVRDSQTIADLQPEQQLLLEPDAESGVLNISVHFGAKSDFTQSF